MQGVSTPQVLHMCCCYFPFLTFTLRFGLIIVSSVSCFYQEHMSLLISLFFFTFLSCDRIYYCWLIRSEFGLQYKSFFYCTCSPVGSVRHCHARYWYQFFTVTLLCSNSFILIYWNNLGFFGYWFNMFRLNIVYCFCVSKWVLSL